MILGHAGLHFNVFCEWEGTMAQKVITNSSRTAKVQSRGVRTRVIVHPAREIVDPRVPVRETLVRLPSRRWEKTLEENLIEEGFTPAKARELVGIAAS
jgi:hypothetical protein